MSKGETVFLRYLLLACGTSESRSMDERLREAESCERCVRRGMWWVFVSILIASSGLGYTAVLLQHIREPVFDLLIRMFSRLGLGSLICFTGFFFIWVGYRTQLTRRRDECRNFITGLLHSCAERPRVAILPAPLKGILAYPEQTREIENYSRR
jgi:hypothetical protein